MKFIFEKTHNKIISIAVAFDAGSRAEGDKYTPGLAHMLEHMMFKGTTKRSYLDIPRDVAFLGGDINAYTNEEMVCYYIRVPYENFEAGMEILADITLNSTFPEDEFLKEKEVVLEEYLSYKDSPTYELTSSFYENFYPGRFKTDIIGTEESIASFTREELIKFYHEFYKTEHAILSISGDIDVEKMKSTSEKFFGKETEFLKHTKPNDFSYGTSKEVRLFKPNMEQSHVLLAWPGLTAHEEDKYVLTVLKDIVGNGMDSRLFTEVREKNNLCYYISMDSQSHLDFGEVTVYSSTREENIDKMLHLINIEIDKIKNELVTDEELQRAKNKSKSDIYSVYDSGHAIAKFKMMKEFFNTSSLEEASQRIDSVSKDDILSLANKLFNDDYKMTFILTSKETEEEEC